MTYVRRSLWLVPVAFFFLNPGFACSSDPEYQYGADEMRAAVEGDWSLTLTPTGEAGKQVTVHVAQGTTLPGSTASTGGRSLLRAAYACGTRTLVASAGACVDSTQMPLAMTFVAGDASFAEARLSGVFTAVGLSFFDGELSLAVGDYGLSLRVKPDGTVTSSTASLGSGASVQVMANRL